MYFLKWWQPSTWLSDISSSLIGGIVKALRTLFYFLGVQIYKVMIYLYKLFEGLCNGRLLDNVIMNKLATRVGLILGLIMLFYVVISFIQMLIDPDKVTDNSKGAVSVIKKVLIVIVMLGISSFAFDTLYSLQSIIIKNHVISKLVLPYDIETDKFGNVLAAELFTTFYRVDNSFYDENGNLTEDNANNEDIVICEAEVWTLKDRIYKRGDFDLGYSCLNESTNIQSVDGESYDNTEATIIDFNWLFMLAVGIAVIYFLISYCIAVGVRMIRLAVLEIISPMAIVSYLSPKQDTMFSKWIKVYFSTYLDVFIRIGIINFAIFLIATLFDSTGEHGMFWKTVNANNQFSENILVAVMIVALLAFAKKAPDLLKELGFSGGNFGGFHIKDALGLQAGIGFAGMGVGAVLGAGANSLLGMVDRGRMAATLGKSKKGIAGAALSGGLGGLGRGLRYGVQNKGNLMKNLPAGIKAQHESDLAYEQLIATGGSGHGKAWSQFSSHFGETKGQGYQRMISNLDRMDKFKKDMYAAADEAHAVKAAKDTWEQMHQNVGESEAAYESRKSAAYERYKNLRNDFVDATIAGNTTYSGGAMDDDDQRYAADIRSTISDANSFSISHAVQRWDQTANGGEGAYVQIGSISSRSDLANASNYAHETKTHITSEPDYGSSIANDQAAGVGDKRRFGPPGGGK